MRRILVAIIAAALVVLAAVLIIRTNRFHSRQLAVEPIPPLLLDTAAAAERLAGALRFRTISNQDSTQFDAAEFRRFQDYLRTSFPRLHARLGREVTGGFSVLYEWRGSDTTLKPILLMAHQDVVPVEPGTEGRWTEPPFAGRISGGFVWGRGSMDDKGNLMALLEAVERLVGGGGAHGRVAGGAPRAGRVRARRRRRDHDRGDRGRDGARSGRGYRGKGVCQSRVDGARHGRAFIHAAGAHRRRYAERRCGAPRGQQDAAGDSRGHGRDARLHRA